MRVVHVITRFIRGGADENTLLTCNGQAEMGHDVTLIYGAECHADMIKGLSPKVRAVHLPSLVRLIHPFKDVICLTQLVFILRRLRPDVLHTHESKAGVLGRVAGRLAGVKMNVHGVHILAFSHAPFPLNLLYRWIEQLTALITDAFVDVSPAMRDEALSANMGRTDNHFVIESGMHVATYQNAQPVDWRRDPDLKVIVIAEPKFLLISGTLETRKRIAQFLEKTFAPLANLYPDTVLLISGDGRERADIAELIDRLGLKNRVFLLGHRRNLANFIALADVCVHAAMREGLARVIVQYAIAGKPVVTTALPGVETLVKPFENGVMTPVQDMAAMTEGIRTVLANLDGYQQRAQQMAQTTDFSRWDHLNMVKGIERIYLQTAKEKWDLVPGDSLAIKTE